MIKNFTHVLLIAGSISPLAGMNEPEKSAKLETLKELGNIPGKRRGLLTKSGIQQLAPITLKGISEAKLSGTGKEQFQKMIAISDDVVKRWRETQKKCIDAIDRAEEETLTRSGSVQSQASIERLKEAQKSLKEFTHYWHENDNLAATEIILGSERMESMISQPLIELTKKIDILIPFSK